jgi:PadR family transcriptional regulator PadR
MRVMNVQFKKGVLELCVLCLVAQQDRYGYELVEVVCQSFEISEGTIYPLLRRLTNEGLFSTYLLESNEGPPRKYYKITDEGLKMKERLLSEWKHFVSGVEQLIKEES